MEGDKDINGPIYATVEQLMAVDQRLTRLEKGLARIEEILEQMDKRLDDTNKRIDDTNRRMDGLRNDLRWFMGISIGIWISIIIPMFLRFLGVI